MVAQRRQLRRRLNSGAYKLRCPRPSAAVFHSFPTPPLGIRDRQACHEEAHRQGADGDADTQAYLCPRREPVRLGNSDGGRRQARERRGSRAVERRDAAGGWWLLLLSLDAVPAGPTLRSVGTAFAAEGRFAEVVGRLGAFPSTAARRDGGGDAAGAGVCVAGTGRVADAVGSEGAAARLVRPVDVAVAFVVAALVGTQDIEAVVVGVAAVGGGKGCRDGCWCRRRGRQSLRHVGVEDEAGQAGAALVIVSGRR